MKRKRNYSKASIRHRFSSSKNRYAFENGKGRSKRRKCFTSLNTIKKILISAIENEQVEKVKEILKKYAKIPSKKQKENHLTKKQGLLLENVQMETNEDKESQPMDIDSSSRSLSEMSIDKSKNSTGKNFRRYITSNKIIQKITWSSFGIDTENKDNVLHYACRCGKSCLIDTLLDTGHFDINEPNFSEDLDSCLTIACDEGQLDTVKILISRGADVNYENLKSKTPLILATELIEPCDTELVKILLTNNAFVNKTTSNSNTALLSASKYGNIQMIEMLLHANANINWEYNDGASPLMRACYYQHPKLVKYLIDHGAFIESKNIRKETPLYIASFRGYLDIVKILIESGANINCEDMDGDTPLSVACYEEKTNVITYLLKNGAFVNKHGIRGDTPLHIAVSNCSKKSVLELIEMGANVDALNAQNETPLHIVTRQSRMEILKILLKHTRNLDVCSKFNKRTPFKSIMEDIQIDKLNMAIMLVKAGCDVNLGYRQMNTFSAGKFYNLFTQPLSSQTYITINTSDSPFKNLFKISKNNFKQVNNQQNDGFFEEEDILSFHEYSTFRSLINLIEITFRAGYIVNPSDSMIYKESWVCRYLAEFQNKTNSLEYKAKQVLDYYFLYNIHKPWSLQNLCKFKTRYLLKKPINSSIQVLDIPVSLKNFLNLDSVEV